MKKISIFLAGLLVAASAFAANTATLDWTPPTTYTDGSPIVGTLTYNIYQGIGPGSTKVKVGTATTNAVTISTGLVNGNNYCWTVTAVLALLESAQSNEACKNFPLLPTAAPTGLTVK